MKRLQSNIQAAARPLFESIHAPSSGTCWQHRQAGGLSSEWGLLVQERAECFCKTAFKSLVHWLDIWPQRENRTITRKFDNRVCWKHEKHWAACCILWNTQLRPPMKVFVVMRNVCWEKGVGYEVAGGDHSVSFCFSSCFTILQTDGCWILSQSLKSLIQWSLLSLNLRAACSHPKLVYNVTRCHPQKCGGSKNIP